MSLYKWSSYFTRFIISINNWNARIGWNLTPGTICVENWSFWIVQLTSGSASRNSHRPTDRPNDRPRICYVLEFSGFYGARSSLEMLLAQRGCKQPPYIAPPNIPSSPVYALHIGLTTYPASHSMQRCEGGTSLLQQNQWGWHPVANREQKRVRGCGEGHDEVIAKL